MRDTVPAEPLTVFISGRLKEMAAERLTACAVVAAMRLRPILFEHTGTYNPERPVFLEAARSSDIFVGLYGDEYGDPVGDRPAPVEEEYLESLDFPLMPRLFLIRSSRRRQRRLRAFLQSIGPHGTAIRYEGAPDFAHVLRQGLAAIVATCAGWLASMWMLPRMHSVVSAARLRAVACWRPCGRACAGVPVGWLRVVMVGSWVLVRGGRWSEL